MLSRLDLNLFILIKIDIYIYSFYTRLFQKILYTYFNFYFNILYFKTCIKDI